MSLTPLMPVIVISAGILITYAMMWLLRRLFKRLLSRIAGYLKAIERFVQHIYGLAPSRRVIEIDIAVKPSELNAVFTCPICWDDVNRGIGCESCGVRLHRACAEELEIETCTSVGCEKKIERIRA